MEKLFFITILALFTYVSAHSKPYGDCLEIADVEAVDEDDLVLTYGYTFAVLADRYCYHDAIMNFQIAYTQGSGDADS